MEATTSSPSTTGTMQPLGKPVTDALTVDKFRMTSSNISGTSTNLENSLKELEIGTHEKPTRGASEVAGHLTNYHSYAD